MFSTRAARGWTCITIPSSQASRLAGDGPVRTEVRTFDTTTPGLLGLSAWLAEQGCTHVAMEATGVYWRPVWHVLSDGEFALTLANAAHVKNVPGRKTDVADALWLADLLAHGLIRASFVPEAPTQELRWLLRTRKQLVREQASHVQPIQKTLEDANLKLTSVLTQIMGVSGRAILQALIDGERDADKLLTLVQRGVEGGAREAAGCADRAHHRAAPVPAAIAPALVRRAGRRRGRHRRGGGPRSRPFPPGGPPVTDHPRRQ